MYKTDSYQELRALTTLKWISVILALLTLVTASAIFCVCIWIRFDLDFWEWVEELNWYTYWYCMFVVLIAMVVVAFTQLLVVFGTVNERRGLLTFSSVLLVVAWILEFIGGIVICLYGVEESDILTDQLRTLFLGLIYKSKDDERSLRILKIVQEYVGCCGAHGSEDYIRARRPVPYECRDRVDGSEYRYGCAQQFAWWLEPWTSALAGVCAGFLIIHIVQIVVNNKLIKAVRNYERTNDFETE